MKQKTVLTIGAAALGLALLSKRKSVSGVGATDTALALQMIRDAGMDINSNFYTLSFSDVFELTRIMKTVKYKAPGSRHRNGSPARYFWEYMQRVANRSGVYGSPDPAVYDQMLDDTVEHIVSVVLSNAYRRTLYFNELERFMFRDGRGKYGAKQRLVEMLKRDYNNGLFGYSSDYVFDDNAFKQAANYILGFYVK